MMRELLSCIPQSIELVHPSADPTLVLRVPEVDAPVRIPIGVTQANLLLSALMQADTRSDTKTGSGIETDSVFGALGEILLQLRASDTVILLENSARWPGHLEAHLLYRVDGRQRRVSIDAADGVALSVLQDIPLSITAATAAILCLPEETPAGLVDRQA